jgi:putative lipase involved disintegration of autophagic bodies
MLGRFESTGITDIAGYVVSDASKQLIIVSFRGTNSIANWITDFTPELVDNPVCSGCQSHLGFLTSWSEVADNVRSALTTGFNLYPNYDLVVTGHSLGGAVATLAAAQLRNWGYQLALVSFTVPLAVDSCRPSIYLSCNQEGKNH